MSKPSGRLIQPRTPPPLEAAKQLDADPPTPTTPSSAADAAPSAASAAPATPPSAASADDTVSHAQPQRVEYVVPEQLGAYRVDGELARGGMGIVLRAHHVELGRDVAIKVLRPEAQADEELSERFMIEARATAQLRHPNIVAIHDVARDPQGNPYLVMDFVRGKSLKTLLSLGTPSPREAARLLTGIADAVAHAHSFGILHRDLKPDNVLIDASSGQPMLTDFGLAKVVQHGEEPRQIRSRELASSSELTHYGEIMGTPRYMAPEQASGKAVSPATDVWALGVILYEALCGRPPFPGTDVMEVLRGVLFDEPLRPRSLNQVLPAALDELTMRCLAKDPAQRFASGGELAEALRRALRQFDRTVVRGTTPPPTHAASRLWLQAAFGLAVIAGSVAFGLLYDRTPASDDSAPPLSVSPLSLNALGSEPETPYARRSRQAMQSLRAGEGDAKAHVGVLEAAAAGGYDMACYDLARVYYEGCPGLPRDPAVALRWFREGAKREVSGCALTAGWILLQRTRHEERLEGRALLDRAARNGELREHPQSAELLEGLGGAWCDIEPRDFLRGVPMLEESVASGRTSAKVRLAVALSQALPPLHDADRSRSLLLDAAQTDPQARFLVGRAYLDGTYGFPRDPAKAKEHLNAAAAAGQREAVQLLRRLR